MMILSLFRRILRKKMFLSFMNYFAIQCFPDTYNRVREGPNITHHVMDLMVRAKKILGQEGRCENVWSVTFREIVSIQISAWKILCYTHGQSLLKISFLNSIRETR